MPRFWRDRLTYEEYDEVQHAIATDALRDPGTHPSVRMWAKLFIERYTREQAARAAQPAYDRTGQGVLFT